MAMRALIDFSPSAESWLQSQLFIIQPHVVAVVKESIWFDIKL
jgi:hypothetical protein